MQPLINDATTALLRAIRTNLENCPNVVLEEIRSRSWASATFLGARHEVTLRLEGDGAGAATADFIETLDAREFQLRGHILADIALVAHEPLPGGAKIRLEALTVEDS